MNLFKVKERRRLRRRLIDGSLRSRVREANVMLPEITSSIAGVHAQREEAKLRYAVLLGGSASDTPLPAVSPVLFTKAKVFRLWATLILGVEIALAGYTASLTVTGGWIVHLIAGIAATILFTGLAKIFASTRIDSGRIEHSVSLLERYLLWVVISIGLVLLSLFIGRFFASAELIFVIASSLLSFLVALLVGIGWTLGDVLAAPHREVVRFTRLSLLADELADLHELAQRTAQGQGPNAIDNSDTPVEAPRRRSGLTAVSLFLMAALCLPADGLTIWVDGSGSLAPSEFDRMREILKEPLPLLEQGEATLAVGTFATELSSLTGPGHRWRLPTRQTVTCFPSESLFAATQKARDAACREATEKAEAAWRQSLDSVLDEYREVLSDIDITQQAPQTCLYPLLDRIVSQAERHIITTDGGHAGCGPPPIEPRTGGSSSMVILVPDADGSGVSARMREREENLKRLYPELTVLPSWKVEDVVSLASRFGNGMPNQGSGIDSENPTKPKGSR